MAEKNATAPKWLNPVEMKAWREYIIASRRLLDALDEDLAAHDLSMADYEVLAQLSDAPDRTMRMSELADVAMISRSRLSHRIKVMEREGWVRREACPDDKRVKNVCHHARPAPGAMVTVDGAPNPPYRSALVLTLRCTGHGLAASRLWLSIVQPVPFQ